MKYFFIPGFEVRPFTFLWTLDMVPMISFFALLASRTGAAKAPPLRFGIELRLLGMAVILP